MLLVLILTIARNRKQVSRVYVTVMVASDDPAPARTQVGRLTRFSGQLTPTPTDEFRAHSGGINFTYFIERECSMTKYGILKNDTNTGNDAELICVFTAPLSIISNKPTYTSETLTLRRKSIYTDIQRWEIQTGMAPVTNGADMLVHNTIAGYTETFNVRMPQIYRRKTISNKLNPSVHADMPAKSSQLFIEGLGSNTLPPGEFIRFTGHSKVYMVKESTRTVDGLNDIKVFPPLLKAVQSDEPVMYGSRVTMLAKYGDDTKIGITYTDGILAQVDSISVIEAL